MLSLTAPPRARRFWRFVAIWRFRLFQRHRHRRLSIERVDDVSLVVLPDVFNPKLFRTGAALARQLDERRVRPGMAVLDMGTGSGIGAVFAARRGARVVAVDIAPAAVRCARINALLHGLEDRIEIRRGDLFTPVAGERFDLVLFNPPFYSGEPREDWEYAWRSTDVIERFGAGLRDVLEPNGYALIILSTDAVGGVATLQRHGWRLKEVWRRSYGNERLAVIEVAKSETARRPL
jgi:methylase of polypeptide subunit release factors